MTEAKKQLVNSIKTQPTLLVINKRRLHFLLIDIMQLKK